MIAVRNERMLRVICIEQFVQLNLIGIRVAGTDDPLAARPKHGRHLRFVIGTEGVDQRRDGLLRSLERLLLGRTSERGPSRLQGRRCGRQATREQEQNQDRIANDPANAAQIRLLCPRRLARRRLLPDGTRRHSVRRRQTRGFGRLAG